VDEEMNNVDDDDEVMRVIVQEVHGVDDEESGRGGDDGDEMRGVVDLCS
jgi:hypothetical protein